MPQPFLWGTIESLSETEVTVNGYRSNSQNEE